MGKEYKVKLDFQLTRQSKILIGILGVVFVIAIVTQWGPGLYGLISNPDMESKRQTLQSSKDLVAASKILKPIETGLYQKTGLAEKDKSVSIFDEKFPETVIREKIDRIIKQAGIPQNYQLNMEPVPGRKVEKISPQARRNLVAFLYQRKLESEKEALKAEIDAELPVQTEAETGFEEESFDDMMMNAWLDETEEEEEKDTEKPTDAENGKEDKTPQQPQKSYENQTGTDNTKNDVTENDPSEWEFASLPDTIPNSIRIELIDLVMSMTERHIVGAEKTLFENEFFKIQTEATSGFFGFGAKEPTTEINFRPNSKILAKFSNLLDHHDQELNKENLTLVLLEYFERIQMQITELSEKLKLAPASYTPESYNVKIKFKAEIDKLVNLNRLIETTTKWLMVRDLQISADNKQNKIIVDVFMIARVYQ